MDDLLNLLGGLGDLVVQPLSERQIARTEVDTLTISTIYASDVEQYETAVIDTRAARILERYKTREAAELGHAKWVADIPTLQEITDVGYGHSIPPTVHSLNR